MDSKELILEDLRTYQIIIGSIFTFFATLFILLEILVIKAAQKLRSKRPALTIVLALMVNETLELMVHLVFSVTTIGGTPVPWWLNQTLSIFLDVLWHVFLTQLFFLAVEKVFLIFYTHQLYRFTYQPHMIFLSWIHGLISVALYRYDGDDYHWSYLIIDFDVTYQKTAISRTIALVKLIQSLAGGIMTLGFFIVLAYYKYTGVITDITRKWEIKLLTQNVLYLIVIPMNLLMGRVITFPFDGQFNHLVWMIILVFTPVSLICLNKDIRILVYYTLRVVTSKNLHPKIAMTTSSSHNRFIHH